MSAAGGSGGGHVVQFAEVAVECIEVLAAMYVIRAATSELRCRELLEEGDLDAALGEHLTVEDATHALASLVSRSAMQLRGDTRASIFRVRARAKRLAQLMAPLK
ncbi:MAG: hypothetical protein HOW73_14745 [Polyangiaceae bacterium]|nr:hypothetical protein [Polyangiaceae bacterium]